MPDPIPFLALSDAGVLPREFAEKIKGMPAFRNRIIHDYLSFL
jgi:uncharacterized protein YutE (UPF0331/DUF86 family)